jgi:histidinol-phosphate aminotransferase
MADLLNRVRQPFNNNSSGLIAAQTALADRNHVARSVALNAEQCRLLRDELSRLGLRPWPTQANFVAVGLGRESNPVFDALLREGIIVRPLAGYELPQAIRITAGTAKENREALEALARVLDA